MQVDKLVLVGMRHSWDEVLSVDEVVVSVRSRQPPVNVKTSRSPVPQIVPTHFL